MTPLDEFIDQLTWFARGAAAMVLLFVVILAGFAIWAVL